MPNSSLRSALRYGIAPISVALATAIRLALDPLLGDRFPFLAFIVAIGVTAWYGGLGPSLLAVALSWLAADHFLLQPRGPGPIFSDRSQVIFPFFAAGLIVTLLSGAVRDARRRARASAAEARRALEAQQAQREWHRITLASIGDAVITTDPRGRVTSLNPAAERLTGSGGHEAAGRPLTEVLRTVEGAIDGTAYFPIAGVVRGEGVPSGHPTVLIDGGGAARYVEHNAAPIKDDRGEVTGVVIVLRDITERKQAEERIVELNTQLQRHNADLQTLLDVLPVGVAIAEDPTCQRIRLNRYFAERWGLPANANVSPALPPRERPLHYKVFKEGVEASLSEMPMFVAASRGIEVPDEEFQVVLDDGRAVALWVSAAPLLDEQGRPRGSVAAMQDITERRRAEAERAELLAREQQARQEAEAMRAQAEAANRAKDRFLAMLSHELRTPLTPVLLTVSAMLDDPRTPADFRPSLEMFRQNIGLEARLIDDLLDVMRTIRGKMSFHWDVVDAHALIGKALDICRSDIQDKRIRLTLDLAAREHHVRADAGRLQQVWWNLVKNAVKFTPEGGTIALRTRDEDGRLVVEVTDTGIGIEPAALSKIFVAFEQVENSITRRYGGLGLGLAISKAIVEAHGGALTAASAGEGRGATFTVVLATVPADEQPPRPIATAPAEHRALNILLVEDDAVTCRITAKLLRHAGHAVTTASSYDTALEVATPAFDLVVCDIGLPGRSGLDLMRELKGRHGLVGVAVSGYGMEGDIERSREAGFVAHLTKPVDFATLVGMIQEATSGDRGEAGEGQVASFGHAAPPSS